MFKKKMNRDTKYRILKYKNAVKTLKTLVNS